MSIWKRVFAGKTESAPVLEAAPIGKSYTALSTPAEVDAYLFKQFGLRQIGGQWERNGREESEYLKEMTTPERTLVVLKIVAHQLAQISREATFDHVCIMANSTDIACNAARPIYIQTSLIADDLSELITLITFKNIPVRECKKGCWVMRLP